jgi:FG-GAP-like repeat
MKWSRAPLSARLLALALTMVAVSASAEVSLTERHTLRARQTKAKKTRLRGQRIDNQGAIVLDDLSGLRYFINTDMTFTTSSSASGAMSDADYTGPVMATTIGGDLTSMPLSDAFDGYNSLCISTNGATGPCELDDPDYSFYNLNGSATVECGGRQVVLPTQSMGTLDVSRKVFVPANDTFARWLDSVTNAGKVPQTVTVVATSRVGSGTDTRITGSSNGNLIAELGDRWVGTFQNYQASGTSPDPRLSHVLQGPGARVGLASVHFADGDPLVHWAYTFTLQPGETGIIMNFATAAGTKAAAATQADLLAHLPWTALQCMTPQETSDVLNFDAVKKGDLDSASALAPTGMSTPGRADLIFRQNSTNHNVAWLMDGTTRKRSVRITPDPSGPAWRIVGVDDFNRDGVNDLVFNNLTTNEVEFWQMGGPTGTDRVGAAVPLTGAPPLSSSWSLSATGDFNNDGHPDLLWRDQATLKLVVWTMGEGGALGTTKTGTLVPTPDHGTDASWRVVAALDFNDDGCRDLLWYNDASGAAVTWNMGCDLVRIDGDFITPANAGGNNWQVVAAGDFSLYEPEGDSSPFKQTPGTNDIVWRDSETGRIVVWHMGTNRRRVSGQFTCPVRVGGSCDPLVPGPGRIGAWTIVGPR